MPWPGAGTAAWSSRVPQSKPPGWYSAPKAMRTTPSWAEMGSLLRSVDGLPGRKNVVRSRLCHLQLAGCGVEWREACWTAGGCHF